MKNVTLRLAAPEDDDFLLHLYTAIQFAEMQAAGWNDARIETFARYSIRKTQYDARFPDAGNWIILYDGELVDRHLIQPGPKVCAFIDLAVLPALQRRGIGCTYQS